MTQDETMNCAHTNVMQVVQGMGLGITHAEVALGGGGLQRLPKWRGGSTLSVPPADIYDGNPLAVVLDDSAVARTNINEVQFRHRAVSIPL
jgi:hypothetical protein